MINYPCPVCDHSTPETLGMPLFCPECGHEFEADYCQTFTSVDDLNRQLLRAGIKPEDAAAFVRGIPSQ